MMCGVLDCSKAEYLHASLVSASERQVVRRAALRHRVNQRAAAAVSEAQRAMRAAARAAVVAGRGQHRDEQGMRSRGRGHKDDCGPASIDDGDSDSDSEPGREAGEGRGAVQQKAAMGRAGQAGVQGVAAGRGTSKGGGGEGREAGGAGRQGSARQKRQAVTVGVQVVVKRLGRKGEVISVSESKGEAIVRVGMMNVSVPLTEL